ncbi:MAG: RNA polymerase sigma factor [Candidatus Krumholzibacteriota bacterium]
MSQTMDDDALMIRTAQGQEAAFRLLVLRWEPEVLSFLVHMMGSVEEAEDLLQETFVQVFRKAESYRAEGKFKSWLFRVAGNLARSRLRRRKILRWVRFDPVDHDIGSPDPAPDAALEQSQRKEAIQASLVRLPQRQKEALVLHRFQGLRYQEVAEAMGTTVPGVESLIQRAMAALRADLAGKGDLI